MAALIAALLGTVGCSESDNASSFVANGRVPNVDAATYPLDDATLLSPYGIQANYLAFINSWLDATIAARFVRAEDASAYRNEDSQQEIPE